MKTTNGMAIGLFGTLIIGTIFDLFSKIPNMEGILVLSGAIKALMGAGIGLGFALSLKKEGVSVVAIMAAGMVGNYAFHWINNAEFGLVQWSFTSIGDPLSCYVSALIAYFALKLLMRRKTPVDLILIPLIGLGFAMLYSFLLAEWVHFITIGISKFVEISFGAVPFLMCVIISATMGMALTAPISSVAICVAISMAAKQIVSPVTNLLTDLISIPGGSATVGFTLAFLIIGKLMVEFPAAAAAMGFVQALLSMTLGMAGNQGVFAMVSYTLPGAVIDLAALVMKKRGLA